MNRKILITGATGFLGTALRKKLTSLGSVIPHSHSHSLEGGVQTDLRDPEAVRDLLAEVKPDIVVHTAAYREPDFCEQNPEECMRLNRDAVAVLAEALPSDATLVYICTDYLFSGKQPPYTEESEPDPVNLYGQSKLEGEQAALSRPNSLSVRVPVLIGADAAGTPTGFIQQMVKAVCSDGTQEVDDVLIRFPTWIDDVAAGVEWLCQTKQAGVWQVSTEHGGTRYALNVEVAEFLGLPHDHLIPSHTVIPRAAERPANSQLSPMKLLKAGGPRSHNLQEVLAAMNVQQENTDA